MKALNFILRHEKEIKMDGYFSKVVYTQKTHDLFWDKLYAPIIDFIMKIADRFRITPSMKH